MSQATQEPTQVTENDATNAASAASETNPRPEGMVQEQDGRLGEEAEEEEKEEEEEEQRFRGRSKERMLNGLPLVSDAFERGSVAAFSGNREGRVKKKDASTTSTARTSLTMVDEDRMAYNGKSLPSSPLSKDGTCHCWRDQGKACHLEAEHKDGSGLGDLVEKALWNVSEKLGASRTDPCVGEGVRSVDFEKRLDLETGSCEKGEGGEMDEVNVVVPPDGGLKAWLVVAGTFAMIMTNFGLVTSYGIFQTYYKQHQLSHLAAAQITWIGSLQTFFVYGGSFLFGKLCDDHGPKWLLITGSLYWQFVLVHGIIFGIGGSMIFLPSLTIVNQYFDKKRGQAMGVIIGAASLGGVVWPLILQSLFDSKLGFQWGTRLASLILATFLGLGCLTMKPLLPPKKTTSWKGYLSIFKGDANYVLFVLGVTFLWINFFTPYFYIPSIASRYGFGKGGVLGGISPSNCVTVMNASSFFGRILSGPISDRVGRLNVLILSSIFSTLILFTGFTTVGDPAGVLIIAILYGITSGAMIAIAPAALGQITVRKEELGTRMGALWSLVSPGLLIGPVVASNLVERMGGDYLGFSLWAASTCLLGVVVLLVTRFRILSGATSFWAVV
ncbi:MFS general substrate transporter [Violaceomyces palustris]|uniref:MFS general substrate transporter n=1 Tax=Violaceomyces palustris TaxID=1673888 RepID=A0ACD0NYE3_9BASI|nr:MFS general substrate transporter [Violaceomyces palustris]